MHRLLLDILHQEHWLLQLKEQQLFELVAEHDIIAFLCTESNLEQFPWGVQNVLYEAYCQEEIDSFYSVHIDEINVLKNKIRSDSMWFKAIREQAATQNKEVEEVLDRNAIFMVESKCIHRFRPGLTLHNSYRALERTFAQQN